MISPAERNPKGAITPALKWQLVAIKVLLLALLAVILQKPCGSLKGQLALEQPGFNLYSYNMREHGVFAIAIGPRGTSSQERGVWVDGDGAFRFDNLPVGEYELRVHAPGFQSSDDSGIFVDDGQVTEMPDQIRLSLERPSLNVACNERVFTTREKPHFWTSSSGCSQATVRVYRSAMLPLALTAGETRKYGFQISTNLSLYKPYDAAKKLAAATFFKGLQPLKTFKRQIESDDYSRQDYQFDEPLKPGDYFVVAEGANAQKADDWSVMWFSVSDLGVIVKQDPKQTLARAVDLNTLRPVAGAAVRVYERGSSTVLRQAVTDLNGFAKLPETTKSGSEIVVYAENGENHAYGGFNYYQDSQSTKYRTMFYTDRPVYRLGQTVYFKGICRYMDAGKLSNLGDNTVISARIEDPDNNEVWSGNLKTNDHGTFNGMFVVPESGKTGGYQMHLQYADNSEDYQSFEVAEYRKPEYQVEVTPLTSRATAGTKVKARVKATYYFGAPVANAKVKYTIFSGVDWSTRYALMDRPSYYSYFDGWDNDDSYRDTSFSGDYINQGYTVTDANGEATVEFDTRKPTFDAEQPWEFDHYDHRYRVEAEVTDISRLSVLGNGSLPVTNGDFEVFVKPSSYVAKVGDKIGAEVRAVAYDGHKPVAAQPLHVRLYRRVYDTVHSTYRGVQVMEDFDTVTDATGKVNVDFNTKPDYATDTYEILATAKDGNQNTIADESSIWIVSDKYPYFLSSDEARKEPLTIKLDKNVYKIGETAKVMISAPVTGDEGVQAIVTVEGPRLYDYKVIDLKATATMVEVPIAAEYAPNVYVGVAFVGKRHQFFERTELIKVSPQDRFLQLSIDSDKEKYKPGDVASYTIKAQYADGKPAPNTEVSLGIVDESIYSIRPDTTPDIRTFFYDKRFNAVATLCSFPEEYSGGPDKIEPRVRKDFRDTACWMPVLRTDAKGIAQATVKLPDNLTTWRATVVGIDNQTDVGEARQKVIATQDMILRLSLPRFFSQGDEGLITAVVHNYTAVPKTVDLTLAVGPSTLFAIKQPLHQKIMVAADKAERFCWPVTALNSGEARVTCKAVCDTTGDAMSVKLPVRPLGVRSFATKCGLITADDATVSIPSMLPVDAVPGSEHLHLYLSSSPLGSVLGNFSSLIDYPYGCVEQTMSKLMPSVVAMRLHQTVGLPLTSADKKKFALVYKMSMDKLNGYQHGDGGWGWWTNDDSQIYLTSLVLDGYRLLSDAGYAVPADRRDNGLKYLASSCAALAKQLDDPKLMHREFIEAERTIDLARGSCVLARYKKAIPDQVRAYALARKDAMTPESLAYFTMAFKQAGDDELAHSFYSRLVDLANVLSSDYGNTTDWAPSKQMFAKLGKKDWWYYSYRYTDVETTALALQAVVALDPDNDDRIESVKHWILMQRGKDGWGNTKTTSQVLLSMMGTETRHSASASPPQFTASIEGSDTAPLSFDKDNEFEKERDVPVAITKGQELKLRKQGTGNLYYTASLTYYKRITPGEFVAGKSMPDGLKLKRQFFRMMPSAPDSNGNVHFTLQPLAGGTVRAGETILMKVYVDAPTELPYVLVEAPLPSGAEAVQNDSRANADDKDKTDSENGYYNFWQTWWTHEDVMDDHLAFFVTSLDRGRAEFHQMMRVEIPGKFEMNPVTVEGMYTESVRAYSPADELKVIE